jgi:hypothetical protein
VFSYQSALFDIPDVSDNIFSGSTRTVCWSSSLEVCHPPYQRYEKRPVYKAYTAYTASTPTMTSTQKSTVILSNPSDWDEWLEIIKTKAVGGEVWRFIDPAIAKDELSSLTEPTIPTPRYVVPARRWGCLCRHGPTKNLSFLKEAHFMPSIYSLQRTVKMR